MSKSDRELLALAARAAGLLLCGYSWIGENEDDEECEILEAAFVKHHQEQELSSNWNPLTDDGDALRLAVKLGLAVIPFPIYREHKIGVTAKLYRNRAAVYRGRAENIEFDEEYGFDAAAATRRAIVRAAAAIGEAMQ